jgi:hypothetical protein
MNPVISFVNSNFFIAFVTFVVGLVALIIYMLQKRDYKKDAANIILLEIQSAERAARKVNENLANEILAPDIFLMPTESWTLYKYLFLRDFDRDEWDLISDFYINCRLLDNDIKYNNSAFASDVDAIRENKQRILADYTKLATDALTNNETKKSGKDIDEEKLALVEKFKKITEEFDTLFMERQGRFAYNPVKPKNDAKTHLQGIPTTLSQMGVGIKLKRIANIK